jgi:hypothetical protein
MRNSVPNNNLVNLECSAANVYTLPVTLHNMKFKIANTDANAKTISLTNAGSLDTEISLRFNMKIVATLTFDSKITWKDGVTPSMSLGKVYYIYLVSCDAGISYQGTWTGSW